MSDAYKMRSRLGVAESLRLVSSCWKPPIRPPGSGRAGHGPSSTQTNVNLDARKVEYEIVGVNTEAL